MANGKIINPGFRQPPIPTKKQLLTTQEMRIETLERQSALYNSVLNQVIEKMGSLEYTATINTKYYDLTLRTLKEVVLEKGIITKDDWEKVLQKNAEELAEEYDRDFNEANGLVCVDREVKDNDVVNISFEGFIDDKPIEKAKAENFMAELGKNQLIGDLEKSLLGKKLNEEFETTVKFPDDYHVEALKGKDAKFKVKILRIKEKVKKEDTPK